MNNELRWEKILEWPQSETTYLINISTDPEQISIEVEDKFSGQIWHSIFSSTGIEQLTTKAKNFKSYPAFTKMLTYALLRQSDSPTVQILSYRQMNSKFGKPGSQSKAIRPQQATKRFLLLTYVNKFEKVQFPLPLMPHFDAGSQRLKVTIERMSREIKLLRQDQTEDEISKQNVLLKYENQSLKVKLKNNNRLDSSMVSQPKMDQLLKEVNTKQAENEELKAKLAKIEKDREQFKKQAEAAESRISQLEQLIKELEHQHSDKVKVNKRLNYYEQKIEQMIGQMNELSADLVYSRQKQKKAELKVTTLQKQLEKMITKKKTAPRNAARSFRDSSPDDKKSQKSVSVRSGKSNTSQKSLNKNRNTNRKTYGTLGQNSFLNNSSSRLNSNSKKPAPRKNSSVYDSDTQSSRMRRMANGRSSPYRQPVQVNKNPKLNNQRNRSRSKSQERMTSPRPSQNIESRPSENFESQVMTEQYQSDSSQDQRYDRIQGFFNALKQKKGVKNVGKSKPSGQQSGTKIQKKLSTLEQLIRKTAQSTKSRQ